MLLSCHRPEPRSDADGFGGCVTRRVRAERDALRSLRGATEEGEWVDVVRPTPNRSVCQRMSQASETRRLG